MLFLLVSVGNIPMYLESEQNVVYNSWYLHKGIVERFRKYAYSLSIRELNEKTDATLVSGGD